MTVISVLLSIVVLLPVLYRYLSTRRRWQTQLPPGPRSYPIFGNLLDVPKVQPWITYRDWSRQYG